MVIAWPRQGMPRRWRLSVESGGGCAAQVKKMDSIGTEMPAAHSVALDGNGDRD